jgi:hypothetical protein
MSQDDLVVARVVTAQSITGVTSGLTVTGGLNADILSGGVKPLAAIATNGTVVIASARIVRLSVAAGATASGIAMPSGTVDGQDVTLVNENATGASTLILPSAANLPTAVTISGANIGRRLVWVSALSLWSPC